MCLKTTMSHWVFCKPYNSRVRHISIMCVNVMWNFKESKLQKHKYDFDPHKLWDFEERNVSYINYKKNREWTTLEIWAT